MPAPKGNRYGAKEDPKSSFLYFRCRPDQKGRYKQAADAKGTDISTWASAQLDAAAKKQLNLKG